MDYKLSPFFARKRTECDYISHYESFTTFEDIYLVFVIRFGCTAECLEISSFIVMEKVSSSAHRCSWLLLALSLYATSNPFAFMLLYCIALTQRVVNCHVTKVSLWVWFLKLSPEISKGFTRLLIYEQTWGLTGSDIFIPRLIAISSVHIFRGNLLLMRKV